jgi:hypothetical protein
MAGPAITHGDMVMAEALSRLAIARGGLLDQFSADVYLERLERFDSRFVAAACAELSDEPRLEFETTLPEVGRIIERIKALALVEERAEKARKLLPLPKSEDDEPRYFCVDCRDETYNWRPFWCPGTGQSRNMVRPEHVMASLVDCGRLKEHRPHDYVAKCQCQHVNPVAAQARDRMNQARAKKPERRQHA